MVNKVLSRRRHSWCSWCQQRSYVTHGDKSCTTTNEINCNQYKPSISVFICDTESTKDSKIHEGDPDEAEHRFNSETYTLSAGAVGMMLYIYMEISQREYWNYILIKRFRSSYEVDLAVLVVPVSSNSGKYMQSKKSMNLELFSETIPSIQRN